jgi:acyl carrier protein
MTNLFRLQTIFRDILDDDSLVLTPEFSTADSVDWDSVATVQIVLAVEEEFGVKLPSAVVGHLTSVSQLLSSLEA